MERQRTAGQQIIDEVTSWPGVEADWGNRGELSLKLGRREIGHLHGDRAAHFGFPKQVWVDLYEQKRIDYHPVFPDKVGPASRRIENDADVHEVIALLRINYDRLLAQHGLPAEASQSLVAGATDRQRWLTHERRG